MAKTKKVESSVVESKEKIDIEAFLPSLPKEETVVEKIAVNKRQGRYRIHVHGDNIRQNKYDKDFLPERFAERARRPTVVVRDRTRPGTFVLAYVATWDGPSKIVSGETMRGGTTTWIETDALVSVQLDKEGKDVQTVSDHTWKKLPKKKVLLRETIGCGAYAEEGEDPIKIDDALV
jgi:hypothetical protein